MIICISMISGCSSESPADSADPVVYENRELGFSIEFPDTWENRYSVEANPDYPSGVIVKTEWGGTLCFIYKETAEEWKENGEGESIPVEYRVLGENDERVYILYFPSDANYDIEDEEQTRVYQEMREDLYHIGFKILEQ